MAFKPKPFSRPSVDLGGEKREWRDVPPSTLRPGDTVVDFGVIDSVVDDGHGFHMFHFISGRSVVFSKDTVRAFVQA
jgi:hypothetical protein